ALLELGDLEQALTSTLKSLELKPENPTAHLNLGGIYKDLGNLDQALASTIQSLELKPDNPTALSNLGGIYQDLGNLDHALASTLKSLELNPHNPDALINLGSIYKDLGNLDQALASTLKSLELKPDTPEGHFNLGDTLKKLGRLEEAQESYKQAIALKPDFAKALLNLGNTLREIGRFEESVSFNQQAFANRTGIRPVGDKSLAPATAGVYFELTNKCNFHCTFCPSDSQKRLLGSMDLELVKQLYEENADKNFTGEVNLHLMGEPTLHPELIEILKFGSIKNVKTNLTTNISTLGARNVSKILDALYGKIIASHMSPTKETYHVRGAVGISWERYIGNLRLLVREYMKRLEKGNVSKNTIDIRVMVTQNTATNVSIIGSSKEAGDILKEWNDFVAEVENELGLAPFERKDHNDDDLVRGNKYSYTSYSLQKGITLTFWRAFTFANTRVSDEFNLKPTKQTSYCHHPFTDIGILWNGDVTLCCLDHDGQLKVGNVRDSSIETVIQSEGAQKLRGSMLGKYPLPSICQTCQERPVKRENTEV
ncbi:MAG TPA: tetratricopeptide repeat protein, partial [Prochlorococcus sp.]|nr:tetratricopeptide repeat protein [Prochlorococcus sp.]